MRKFFFILVVFSLFLISCDNCYNVAEEKNCMQKLIWINADGDSVDLTSGNYGITEWNGFSGTELNIQSQQVPFHDGSVFLDGLLSERELSVTLAIDAKNDLEKRYRLRRELIEILNPKMGEGYLIYHNDFTSKRIKCVPQIPLFENCNSNDSGTPKASLAWTACDPYWEDLEETVIAFNALTPAIIDNKSDISVQLKAKLFTGYCKNVSVNSVYTEKFIKINDTVNRPLEINTNFGQKDVMSKEYNFKWSSGGQWKDWTETNKRLIITGSNTITMSMNKTVENIYGVMDVVCYSPEKNLFVGWKNVGWKNTGDNKHFLYSSDGINWNNGTYTDGTYPLDSINRIIWVNEKSLFVAVGQSNYSTNNLGLVYTSSDGITWTLRFNGHIKTLKDVAYSPSLGFLAVGVYNGNTTSPYRINKIKSTDGITWTEYTAEQINLISVTWSNTFGAFFVAQSGVGSEHFIKYSYDGQTWQSVKVNTYCKIKSVQSIESLGLVFVGGSYQSGGGATALFLAVYDGEKWTSKIYDISIMNYFDVSKVFFSRILNEFVVIGSEGAILTGSNFENLKAFASLSTYPFFSIISFKNKFYAVGEDGRGVKGCQKSVDGQNWQNTSTSSILSTMTALYNIFYSKQKDMVFVLGDKLFGSIDDGENWQNLMPNTTMYLRSMTENENMMLAVGVSNIVKSLNGLDWNEITSQPNFWTITHNKNVDKFFAITSSGGLYVTGNVKSSTDGESWDDMGYQANYIQYVEEFQKMVACISGNICISFDGNNWRKCVGFENTSGYLITKIAVGKNNVAIAVLRGMTTSTQGFGKTFMSTDLIHWSEIETFESRLLSIAFNPLNDLYVLTSCDGEIITEASGKNSVYASVIVEKESLINKVSFDSDMNLSLEKGKNKISLSYDEGNCNCILTYRQKYVGV